MSPLCSPNDRSFLIDKSPPTSSHCYIRFQVDSLINTPLKVNVILITGDSLTVLLICIIRNLFFSFLDGILSSDGCRHSDRISFRILGEQEGEGGGWSMVGWLWVCSIFFQVSLLVNAPMTINTSAMINEMLDMILGFFVISDDLLMELNQLNRWLPLHTFFFGCAFLRWILLNFKSVAQSICSGRRFGRCYHQKILFWTGILGDPSGSDDDPSDR